MTPRRENRFTPRRRPIGKKTAAKRRAVLSPDFLRFAGEPTANRGEAWQGYNRLPANQKESTHD